jgi:DNA-binding SARP family transcriptional activator/DNA-binding beta-propeller fold protein YncE
MAGTCPHLAYAVSGLESTRSGRYVRTTTEVEFHVLGPLEVIADGGFLPLGGAKQRAVLAILLLHANEVVGRDRLIDELWGESPPESAANMLQGYISHLRKTLEPSSVRGQHELIVSRPPGYLLKILPDQLDAARFEQLAKEGKRSLDNGDAEAAAERLREALALWRGRALDDLAYETFARASIERLEELRLQTIEDRIDADLALGRHNALVGELRELVDLYPLRERLRAQLMTALYRCGRQADALEVYREGRRVVRDELGIEPGPALRGLQQSILRQDPLLGVSAATPPPIIQETRRRWALIAAGVAAAAAATATVVATVGSSSGLKTVAVRPHSVAVIDPSRNRAVADIPTGDYPVALAADNTYVYAANFGDATVSRLLPKPRKLYDTFALSRASDMVAGDRQLWVANGGAPGHSLPGLGSGTVAVMNEGPTVKAFRVGPDMNGTEEQTSIAADNSGYSLWAGNQDSRTVRQIDRTTARTLLTIHGIAPGGLAVVGNSSEGDTVWASEPTRNVVVRIDEHTRRIVARIPIPKEPTRLVASEDAVWVITRDRNGSAEWRPTRGTHPALWRIDPTTNKPVAQIPLPLTPMRVALGEGSVWVTAERVLSTSGATGDATVFRIDPKTNRIVARIPLRTRAVDGIIVSHGLVWAAIPASQ